MPIYEFAIFLMFIIVVLIFKCIKVVPVGYVYVIEFIWKSKKILKEGTHFIVPFISKIKSKVSMKEQCMDVPPQGVKTKEDILISVSSKVFYRIIDPIKAVYNIEDIRKTLSYAVQITILENLNGAMLDEVYDSKDSLQSQIYNSLNKVAEECGCKVNRVDINDIRLPKDIAEVYEKKEKLKQEKMILGGEYLNTLDINKQIDYKENNISTEWHKNLKKYWQNKDLEKIISLFDGNVTYYKNSSTRLYTKQEIEEEWQELIEEDFVKLDFNVVMQHGKEFVLNIIAVGRFSHDIVAKIELGADGKCTYFKKWEDNN